VYVRISIVRPIPAELERVGRVLDDLTEVLARQQGYLGGLRLETEGPDVRPWPAVFATGLLGRVTLWSTEADADRSAQASEVVSLRSQLNNLTVDHHEYAFYGTEIPAASS
jgi:hypothetical protein